MTPDPGSGGGPYLPDAVLRHVREVAAEPDLDETRYRLGRLLGRGGMGLVYEAIDEALGRRVALKVSREGAPVPLAEEARIIASLEHPGVVPLYDAGTLADGRAYYAMKLVDGERLDQWVGRRNPPLPARLTVFLRLCETAAYAHSRGVIHRDLKPRNIMVGAFGQVLVLDWGVAGRVAGTPDYAAPELGTGTADARGDVYSLGAILRFLLHGTAARAPLHAIAGRAAERAIEARYRDVDALIADLERFQNGEPVSAHRESSVERAARFARRNQTLLLLLAAYVAVRFALFFWRAVKGSDGGAESKYRRKEGQRE